MRQETILNYKNFLWLWICLAATTFFILIYAFHDPIGLPYGGTFLGYFYGILSAIGMCVLMWYGIRKRSYFSSKTTLKGALAFHIWLGTVLLILVPLHAGFHFGWNIHTLAYILMVFAILTGIWGAISYFSLAPEIESHRGKGSIKEMIQQLELLSVSIDGITIRRSREFVALTRKLDFSFTPSIKSCLLGNPLMVPSSKETASLVSALDSTEREEGVKLIGLLSRKYELAELVRKEVKTHFWLKLWLYMHAPLACGAFVVMWAHIISVFYYW
ncbi:MAG: hypothetical protein SGJ02_01545 [bacterium]|nr:hypothetical protein [bacterium]